jgi:hypothetical protein
MAQSTGTVKVVIEGDATPLQRTLAGVRSDVAALKPELAELKVGRIRQPFWRQVLASALGFGLAELVVHLF